MRNTTYLFSYPARLAHIVGKSLRDVTTLKSFLAMKRQIVTVAIAVAMLSPGLAFASEVNDWGIPLDTDGLGNYMTSAIPTKSTSTAALLGQAGNGANGKWYFLGNGIVSFGGAGSAYGFAGNELLGIDIPFLNNNLDISGIQDGNGVIAKVNGKVDSDVFNSAVSSLQGQIYSLSGQGFNPRTFFGNNGTTTPFIASSTAGLMSAAMVTKLNGLSTVATSGSYNDLSDKPTITSVQSGSCTTDASGNCTLTFGTTFGSTPKVAVTAIQGTTGTLTNAQVTSKSGSSVTIHVNTLATIIGILTLSGTQSGIVVDVIATV